MLEWLTPENFGAMCRLEACKDVTNECTVRLSTWLSWRSRHLGILRLSASSNLLSSSIFLKKRALCLISCSSYSSSFFSQGCLSSKWCTSTVYSGVSAFPLFFRSSKKLSFPIFKRKVVTVSAFAIILSVFSLNSNPLSTLSMWFKMMR